MGRAEFEREYGITTLDDRMERLTRLIAELPFSVTRLRHEDVEKYGFRGDLVMNDTEEAFITLARGVIPDLIAYIAALRGQEAEQEK